ncbi:TAZ zinc finger domain protein [Nitzschia inconspicua]|uniref:TAZ zinc finger domain protein n=1 Tax=Nitzschia inconspicua TaxID=303405 RepID=A0A9K3L6X3_9STRA|nr:TAZ zinc finger domain protein [Nitzschia inconspicua]
MTIHDGVMASQENDPLSHGDSASPCSDGSSDEGHKTKETPKNNVSELVTKSKKAASSLWTLLHAKNCRLGVNMCSHVGCPEAKLMYLHLKTCTAVLLEPCPRQHQGCQDARKLLAHYRRCRDIRARQAQNPALRSQQHVCLVCSLVARHAKFTLDRTTSPGSRLSSAKSNANSSHFIPSLIIKEEESFDEKSTDSSSAVMFSQSYDESRGLLSSRPRSASASQRFPFSRPVTSSRAALSNSSDRLSAGRGFQALQAVVSCAIEADPSSVISASLDPIVEDSIGRTGFSRSRSESFDVQSSQYSQEEKESEAAKNMSYLYLAAVENLDEEPKTTQARRRSQSCSVPSASSASSVNSMLDKPMGEELQCILRGDS